MLPDRMHNHPDGFFFDRDQAGLVRLNFGAFGLATLNAHQAATAALAKSGVNLILDEVLLSKALLEQWHQVFEGVAVFWVGVHCDLNELERREIARGDRVHGQARGQFDWVHRHVRYDVEVDTTATPSATCAAQIVAAIEPRNTAQ